MLRRVDINRDSAENELLRAIYDNAFPIEERIPFYKIFDLLDLLGGEFSAYYDGETLVGLYIGFKMKKYNYGGYRAVEEKLRGRGYGQKILNDILDRYKNDYPFLADCESPLQADAPNLEIRKRRHAYYLRNKITDTGTYITYNGVQYTIMTNSKDPIPKKDIDEAFDFLQPIRDTIPVMKGES